MNREKERKTNRKKKTEHDTKMSESSCLKLKPKCQTSMHTWSVCPSVLPPFHWISVSVCMSVCVSIIADENWHAGAQSIS